MSEEEQDLFRELQAAQAMVGLLLHVAGGKVVVTRAQAEEASETFAGAEVVIFQNPKDDTLEIRLDTK